MKLVVAAIVLAIACSKPEPAPVQTTDLDVVTAGTLPQHVVRYAAPKGQKTTLEIVIDNHLAAGETGGTSPGLVFTIDLAVDDVMPDQRMKLSATITELVTPAAKDEPGGAHAQELADKLKGTVLHATLAPNGVISDVGYDAAGLSDAAREQLVQLATAFPKLAMPLPTVPIGIGAKWKSTRSLAAATPVALTSVTTIDLAGIEGTQLDVIETSEVTGSDQTVHQDGASVDIKGIHGTATGHGKIDLQKLVWIGTMSAELHMDMTIGSDTTAMVMIQTLTTSLR